MKRWYSGINSDSPVIWGRADGELWTDGRKSYGTALPYLRKFVKDLTKEQE